MNALCWYSTRDDFLTHTKKCIIKYSMAVNQTFGWAPVYYDTVKDVYWNG